MLDEHDVMTFITKAVFDCYISSEDYHVDMFRSGVDWIPPFDEMVRAGLFILEQTPIVSDVAPAKDKDVTVDMTTVNNGNSKDCLFVTSWNDEVLEDTEEYEVVFEAEDDTAHQSTCNVSIDEWFNVIEEAPVFKVQSVQLWGGSKTRNRKAPNVLNLASKQDTAYAMIENGELMFVVDNQRKLIVIFDSARVFDPGGGSTKDKRYQPTDQTIKDNGLSRLTCIEIDGITSDTTVRSKRFFLVLNVPMILMQIDSLIVQFEPAVDAI